MNFVDIIIALLVVSSAFRGRELGFVRQLFSTAGFFGGLIIGAYLIEPHIIHLVHTVLARSVVAIFTTIGCALILLSVGEYIGVIIKQRVRFHLNFNWTDDVFGIAIAIVGTLGAVWLSAAILLSLPLTNVQTAIKGSAIVTALNQELPAAPAIISDIGKLIDPNGFPEVFTGAEPAPKQAKLPPLGELEPAVRADQASVVKIEGQGCGGIVEGSGFVISSDLVATNAHVVAGISNPYVVDGNGTREGKVVLFDPNLDFAVLRVTNLAGKPLSVDADQVNPDTDSAVLGYPGGGGFTASPAEVLEEFTALGRNIYGTGNTERDVYEIKATVIPGNSGGPLIDQQGTVIGVVFAQSTTYQQTGYALTSSGQVQSEINQAKVSSTPVSTGGCAQ